MPKCRQDIASLEGKMSQPGFWDDSDRSRKVVSELRSLKAVVGPVTETLASMEDLQALYELANEEDDAASMAEADTEAEKLEGQVSRLELATLLNGPHDRANCYFSIQAGAGGTDA